MTDRRLHASIGDADDPPLRNTIFAAALAGLLGTLVGYAAPKLVDRDPAQAEQARELDFAATEAPEVVAPRPAPAPIAPSLPAATRPERAEAPRAKQEDREPAPKPKRTAEANIRPSFNCRYARTASEKMVCGDAVLARADRRLHAVFEDAMANARDPRRLRREQDRWLAQRERLAGDEAAVLNHYQRRIAELDTN